MLETLFALQRKLTEVNKVKNPSLSMPTLFLVQILKRINMNIWQQIIVSITYYVLRGLIFTRDIIDLIHYSDSGKRGKKGKPISNVDVELNRGWGGRRYSEV